MSIAATVAMEGRLPFPTTILLPVSTYGPTLRLNVSSMVSFLEMIRTVYNPESFIFGALNVMVWVKILAPCTDCISYRSPLVISFHFPLIHSTRGLFKMSPLPSSTVRDASTPSLVCISFGLLVTRHVPCGSRSYVKEFIVIVQCIKLHFIENKIIKYSTTSLAAAGSSAAGSSTGGASAICSSSKAQRHVLLNLSKSVSLCSYLSSYNTRFTLQYWVLCSC